MKNTILPANQKLLVLLLLILFSQGLWAQPVISSFSPLSGPIGTTDTILGNNFDPNPINNIVYFGAVRANVSAGTSGILIVTVPAGATYEPITVTASNLTAFSDKPFLVTFPSGGTNFSTGSFASKIDFATGTNPQSISAGDFDLDGKADVAVANGSSNSVSIYKNTSSTAALSFSSPVNFPTGIYPAIITNADIDGDGRLDVITANYNSNNISVLRNISTPGNISFASKIDIPIGGSAVFVAARDLNSDGKPDLAVLNNSSNLVSLFKNASANGIISFATKIDYPTGVNPQGLWIGDVTGDSKPDVVVVKGDKDTLSVYKNISTNSISFEKEVRFNGASTSYSVTGGDLDGDGRTDLVAANSDRALVTIFPNTTNGADVAFSGQKFYGVEQSPVMASIGDMDGDGKPDISVVNWQSRTVSILKNANSNGSFFFSDKVSYATGSNPASIALCDFDGDGRPDIAVVNSTSNSFSILRNTVTNPFSPKITSFTPNTAGTGTEVTITGTNLTGATNVAFGGIVATSFTVVLATTIKAIVDTGASGSITVTTPNGNASIAGFIYVPKPTIVSFSPGTAGTDTIVTITGSNFTGATKVTFGGTNASSYTIVSSTLIKAVVASGSTGDVSVITPGGVATLAGFTYMPPPLIASFTPANAGAGSVVTITGSNFSDVTSVNFGEVPAASFNVISPTTIQATVGAVSGGSVSVMTKWGMGRREGFYNGVVITSFAPEAGAIGTAVSINGVNFNPVADSNIVYFGAVKARVISAGPNQIVVAAPAGATYQPLSVTTNKNTAYTSKPFNITFAETAALTANSFVSALTLVSDFNSNPYDAAIGDLNEDGKSDLVVPNYNSSSFSIFKNTGSKGSISFASKVDYTCKNNPTKISLTDIDGDGKPDIIVHYYGSSFSIYRNTAKNGVITFSPPVFDTLGGISNQRIAESDLDSDGKIDFAAANDINASLAVARNTTNNNSVSFNTFQYFPAVMQPRGGAIGDFDGDGKPDIALSNANYNAISVFRNVSTQGKIQFSTTINIPGDNGLGTVSVADFNGDGKPDIAVANQVYKKISILQNTSVSGAISFSPAQDYVAGTNPYDLITDDLNGDGKPDLAIVDIRDTTLSLFENNSVNGAISFKAKVDFPTGTDPVKVSSGDIDGDGKSDVAVVNFRSGTISIFQNRVGPLKAELCPGGSTAVTSDITGGNYQWQVNIGSGFQNIANNGNYNGSNTKTLQLHNLPSSWSGYLYRCVVDGSYGETIPVSFVNIWTGAVSNAWENAANWSCGSLPDSNTDVVINNSAVVISSNVFCRSLKVNSNASVTISSGYTLTLTK